VIGKQNHFKTCHSERSRSEGDAQSKNPEIAGCDHAALGSATETVWGERLDAAMQRALHRDPSTRARVHARHAQDDSGVRVVFGTAEARALIRASGCAVREFAVRKRTVLRPRFVKTCPDS
jgi:hypothetical protein